MGGVHSGETRPATASEWGVLKVGAVSFGSFNEHENKALPFGVRFDPRYEVRSGDFLMGRATLLSLLVPAQLLARHAHDYC